MACTCFQFIHLLTIMISRYLFITTMIYENVSKQILVLSRGSVVDFYFLYVNLFMELMKAKILIVFSFLEFPIPNGIAFIGEIGLGGELRVVSMFVLSHKSDWFCMIDNLSESGKGSW